MIKSGKILVAVILFSLNIGFAQVYHPLPMDSTCWRVCIINEIGPGILTYDYYLDYTNGDTIINTIKYSKIYRLQNSNTTYYSAIRQDTAARLVYYVGSSGIEDTLYDFNLIAGQHINGCPSETINLVDSVLINSVYHKRFNVNSYYSTIEGIGNTQGPFNVCYTYATVGVYLVQMIYAGVTLYQDPSMLYDTISSCQAAIATDVKFVSKKSKIIYCYYNSDGDYLDVRTDDVGQQNEIEIYTVGGQKLITTKNFNNRARIDLKGLSGGIYFVSIKFSDGNMRNEKIVISK